MAVIGIVAASLSGVAASNPAHAPTSLAGTVDRAPLRTIRGEATSLWTPNQIARTPDGSLVVANEGLNGEGASVTVHAGGADGDAAPVRRLAGPRTGFVTPAGVAVDTDGTFYVSDYATNRIAVFAPGARGDVAPTRVISGSTTRLDGPVGLHLAGSTVIVANTLGNDVLVFAKGASSNTAPQRRIAGDATGLTSPYKAVQAPSGELVVGTLAGWVRVFGSGANGNTAPVRSLEGARSGFGRVTGIALDAERHLYVASQDASAPVVAFAPGAGGTAQPIARLDGDLNDLAMPQDLTVLPNGQFVVSDMAIDAVLTFASLSADQPPPPTPVVKTPGKVRALKVKNGPRKVRRPVTWRAPAADGGTRVTGYRVVVRKGKRTVLTRTVTKQRVVLRKGKLPKGRLVVRVQARNSKGFGPAATKRFRVRG